MPAVGDASFEAFQKVQTGRSHMLKSSVCKACELMLSTPQRFAAANTSSEHRQTQHVQQERSPRSVPRSSAKRTKVNTARPESAAKTRSSQQQAVSSHSGRSLSKEHQQPASTKPSRRHEVPAAVADPLGAFASRGGLKQRSLQSGLKLLKGKASGPVDPGLQPAHCSFPEQLVRQQVVVSKARPQHHHQVQTTADSLQKYAYAPQQKQAKIKLTGNCQQQDVQQVYSTVDPQSRSQASKDMQAAAPASSAVPTAKTIDPHYMQKVKKSLCQLMQDRHRLQLESNLTAGQPLVSLLASKLDGVNITAALAKYRNQVPPGQKHAAGKSNSAQQAHSAARSSVACTPSPEAAAEPNHMPEQVTSSWQRHAADMAHLPAQHTCFRHVASTCTMTTAHLREHFRPMHSCLSLRHSGRSSQLHQHSQFKRRLELSDDSQLDQYAELSGNNQSDFVPYEQPLTDGHNSSIDMLLHSRYDQQQHSDMDLSVSDDDGQPDSCHWRRMQLATPSAGLNRCSTASLMHFSPADKNQSIVSFAVIDMCVCDCSLFPQP